jgi:gas vesicle protein
MIDSLIKANLPLLKTVFIVGAVAGLAVGGTVGAGVGYAVGTLFAPKSGQDLREDMCNKVADLFGSFTNNPSNSNSARDNATTQV